MAAAHHSLEAKSASQPDDTRPFVDKGRVEVVHLSGGDAGLGTFEPGWRWSEHVKPLAGTDSCQVAHVGYVLKGRMHVAMDGGEEVEIAPGDFFTLPPGHDAWTVGDETCMLLDFGGLHGYAQKS
jgi:quercetin dioxygenase-like cupin family protein